MDVLKCRVHIFNHQQGSAVTDCFGKWVAKYTHMTGKFLWIHLFIYPSVDFSELMCLEIYMISREALTDDAVKLQTSINLPRQV